MHNPCHHAPMGPSPSSPSSPVAGPDCSECERPKYKKGLCSRHYLRMYRNGQPGLRGRGTAVGVGVWKLGPIISDSSGTTFVARCEDHPAFAEMAFSADDLNNVVRDHWRWSHRGTDMPAAVRLAEVLEAAA